MFENFINKLKPTQENREGATIYHLSEKEIDAIRAKTVKDVEIERKKRDERMAREMADREEADRIRKLLQQQDALNRGPYVINEEDRKEANKFIGRL